MTQGLLAAWTAVGLEVMGELMDVEVVELAGPKGKHDPARTAMRHGTQPGTVTLAGGGLGSPAPGAHHRRRQAKTELEQLARSLGRQRPGAAASLREGLELTLTVTRLGVGGKLLQTVESTNPVESMIEIIGDHAGRVKRWSSGESGAALGRRGDAGRQGQFRRVKGYQELPQLALALERATAEEPGLLDLPAAVGA